MQCAALFASLLITVCALAQSASAQQGEHVEIPLGGGRSLFGVLFVPAGQLPAPGVLVLHTLYGRAESFDEQYARALSREGFVALAANYLHPDLAGRPWAPRVTEDMVALVEFLRTRPESRAMPVGTVGFSLGSRGLLLAARHPEVKAVVVYYGTFDARKEKGIKLPPAAVVPLQVAAQVNAAVLLLHGDADNEIPVSSAREMKVALDQEGKKVVLVEYKGAYHRFDRGPTAAMHGERSPAGYLYRRDASAASDAFERTLRWLKDHLR